MTAAVEAETTFSQSDLFAMTQGWPVVTECALADLARTALSRGLRFFPLAQLDAVKEHFVDSWLPALESRHRWLIEVSNLPLLSLDLLLSLYDDLGTAVQECLSLGWLEPCRKNIGFYQINVALDVLILSVYAQFRNDDVLRRAAGWYQLNGYPTEAVQCLVSFVDNEQVLSLLNDDISMPADSISTGDTSSPRVSASETFGAAASVVKDSLKRTPSEQVSPMAKAIIAKVDRPGPDLKKATGGSSGTFTGKGAKIQSRHFPSEDDAAEHLLNAFSYHQDKDPEAVALALAEAVEAGIDRRQLSAVIDFMDIHIRPLLRSEGGPLQLALKDLKHSAPAREVLATQQQQLNHRELQVLQRVCEGYKNKEISEQLGLELSTIKWYATGIYEKLQVRNRTQAVAKAQALKLFD
jgi:DNA-binding CsgD family transcriptional regulator